MIDKKSIKMVYRATKSDRMVMVITFLSTMLLDLEMAIYVGVFLSIALFMKKSSNSKITKVVPRELDNKLFAYEKDSKSCPQISIYQLEGELFFGSVSELEDQLTKLKKDQGCIVILRMKQVHIIDASGAHLIDDLLKGCCESNGKLILTGVSDKVKRVLDKSGVTKKIGQGNIVEDTTLAVALAYDKYVNKEICKKCISKIFYECQGK